MADTGFPRPPRDDAEREACDTSPRELFRAQGFPDSYRIEVEVEGRVLSKSAQVRCCGNSVCPPLAAALVRAQLAGASTATHTARSA